MDTPPNLDPTQEILHKTQPWLRFLGIMGFVFTGFMVLAGIGMTVIGSLQLAGVLPTNSDADPAYLVLFLGIMYLILSGLYVYPSLTLVRAARYIRESNATLSLEQQRKFWKYVGILTIAMLCLYFLAIFAAVLIPGIQMAQKAAKAQTTQR